MRGRFHKRVLLAVVATAAGGLAVWVASRPPVPPPESPTAVSAADLPRQAVRGVLLGNMVRVPFEWPLQPTADPRVWTYHPGFPPAAFAPTVRVHFRRPVNPTGALNVVVGRSEGLEVDALRRLGGVPGVAVIGDADLVPPARP